MDSTLKIFELWCSENGWITKRNESASAFPDNIVQRFPHSLDTQYYEFICYFSECYTVDEQSWFLCETEYTKEADDTELGWNVMESMSLEASEHEHESQSIKEWWDDHLPILLSTRDGYSHFSISLEKGSFGQVVEGYEPVFEDVVIIANSFVEFLGMIMDGSLIFI